MLDTSLAARYATALFSAAQKEKCVPAVLDEIGSFLTMMSQDTRLKKLFFHPAIPPSEKKLLLDDLVGNQLTPISKKFLSTLLEAKRVNYLELIYQTMVNLNNKSQNKVKACVWSVLPLNDSGIRKKIKECVEHYLGKNIDLDFAIDPTLLGGVKLVIEDRVVDGTILYNLKKMEQKIAVG
jgi:F-type H+-transporting ATPase subunit delta